MTIITSNYTFITTSNPSINMRTHQNSLITQNIPFDQWAVLSVLTSVQELSQTTHKHKHRHAWRFGWFILGRWIHTTQQVPVGFSTAQPNLTSRVSSTHTDRQFSLNWFIDSLALKLAKLPRCCEVVHSVFWWQQVMGWQKVRSDFRCYWLS